MLLIFGLTVLLRRYLAGAVPLPATSVDYSHPVVTGNAAGDPTGCGVGETRTAYDILWSCLATSFACTWLSVHPNVPFKKEGKWSTLTGRIFLMLFAILAPEIMIMWAFKQWRGAVMIKKVINDARPDPYMQRWTTTHGHFLQMGGFRLCWTELEQFLYTDSQGGLKIRPESDVLADLTRVCLPPDADEIHRRIYPDLDNSEEGLTPCVGSDTLSISSAGTLRSQDFTKISPRHNVWEGPMSFATLKRALSEDLTAIPDITAEEINDRSKNDALSKGIAFVQLTWFIIQIIARKVQGLVITELEITTVALAGLSTAMYIFWWNKPLDVQCPIIILTKGAKEQLVNRVEKKDVQWRFDESRFSLLEYFRASFTEFLLGIVGSLKGALYKISELLARPSMLLSRGAPRNKRIRSDSESTCVANEEELSSQTVKEVDDSDPLAPEPLSYDCSRQPTSQSFSESFLARMILIFPFSLLILYVDLCIFIPTSSVLGKPESLLDFNDFRTQFICAWKVKTTRIFYSEEAEFRPLLSYSAVAGAIFGGIHCLAWQFSFPSQPEQFVWRAASLGVTGVCAFALIALLVTNPSKLGSRLSNDRIPLSLQVLIRTLFFTNGLFLPPIPFVYPFARMALLIIAFTSLRSLPCPAYQSVGWIQFIPHV